VRRRDDENSRAKENNRIKVVVLHDRPEAAVGLIETLTFVDLLPLFAVTSEHADLIATCDVDGRLLIDSGVAELTLADPCRTLLRRWQVGRGTDIQLALAVRDLMLRAGRSRILVWGPLRIQPRLFEATLHGRRLVLSPLQLRLLTLLAAANGEVVARQQIAARVFGDTFDRSGDRLDAHVRRLRQILEDDPAHPRFLLTVRGEGLRLADLDEDDRLAPAASL
jgi:hypothetical protein